MTKKYDLQGKVKITYVQQPIPSPLGMLQYDTIFDTKDRLPLIFLNIFENTQTLPVYSQDVDFTGYSCKRYSDVIKVVDTLNTMKKCLTGYVITTSEFKFPALHPDKFKSELRNTITKKVHHVRNTLLSKSQKFQQINTEMWNPASKKVTKFIVPPVVPYDEISTRGMGMSLIHLLELVGIVNRTETGENHCLWGLSDDWEERHMILALDGLSIDRFRSFLTGLENVPMSFTKIYEQNMIFQKAMSKVICVPGQLHMSFHMLQCIFTIFTDLLSCSQKCLEWKKLTHKQVSLSYNLCKSLLFITVEETERLLINLFVKEKCDFPNFR